jgi:hypothetical protein
MGEIGGMSNKPKPKKSTVWHTRAMQLDRISA